MDNFDSFSMEDDRLLRHFGLLVYRPTMEAAWARAPNN